jgi:formamidopyrimidine-DNA glycosylase
MDRVPELPEVETIVRGLRPLVVGRRVVRARYLFPRVLQGGRCPPIEGQTVLAVRRRGKFILLQFDGGALAIHLGMTGRLLSDAEQATHTRAVIEFDQGALIYDDIRQFGRMRWSAGEPAVGPDALSIAAGEFLERLSARRRQIKPLLLDQGFLAGLGNIYADEALFAARVHPRAMAHRLSRKRALALHAAIRDVLTAAIQHGGSSISDYVDPEGRRGGFQALHQVYGRDGEPCPRCGATLVRIVVAQRGTHLCPRCQRA